MNKKQIKKELELLEEKATELQKEIDQDKFINSFEEHLNEQGKIKVNSFFPGLF